MSAESDVYAALSGVANVYPDVCTAEPPPNQFIVYSRISSVPHSNTLAGGYPALWLVRMQIDIYARSKPAVMALAESARTAMYASSIKGFIQTDGQPPGYEGEVKFYRWSLDWMVWQ